MVWLSANSFGLCQALDFDLLWKGGGAQGRGDFEDAVVVFRGELVRIHTFWQLNRSLDASISELLLHILALLFLSLAFILTFHCEAIALKGELDLFGGHARRHSDTQVIFFFSWSIQPQSAAP